MSGWAPSFTLRVRRSPPRSTTIAHLVVRAAGVHGGGHVVGLAHVGVRRSATIRSPLRRPALAAGPLATTLADRRAAVRWPGPSRRRDTRAGPSLPFFSERQRALDRVDRDGEADAGVLVAAAVGLDLRVDADHAALRVEQRAAGVAGVDRGVGLHRAGDREAVGGGDRASERGDDAAGHGALEAERAADGDRRVAGAQVLGGAEPSGLRSRRRPWGRPSAARGRPTGRCRAAWPRSACRCRRSARGTASRPATTWSLVTMWPSSSITKPEPEAARPPPGNGSWPRPELAWTNTTPGDDAGVDVGDVRACRGAVVVAWWGSVCGARRSCRRRRRRPRSRAPRRRRRPTPHRRRRTAAGSCGPLCAGPV